MKTINLKLNIEDVISLIEYYDKMYCSIPKNIYKKKNMSRTTMQDTANKYLNRKMFLQQILDATWPK